MYKNKQILTLLLATLVASFPAGVAAKKRDKPPDPKGEITGKGAPGAPVLWREPTDIASRNLYYGPGGKEHEPRGVFTFEKEDMEGTSPKFTVRDQDGVKWKAKLEAEVRSETVATRLVWAAGYFANEDYFLPSLKVANMPARLHRGQKFVDPDGTVHDVRLKRYLEGEKKTGTWKWAENPFTGTRELNALRVLMALINNWDLKDENNAIYSEKHSGDSDEREVIYMISDLGASFGTIGLNRSHEISKGNYKSYSQSKLIKNVGPDYVDFEVPSRAALVGLVDPKEFARRLKLEWIGRHIPRADAKWLGQLLAQLSQEQIRDAFRSAYPPDVAEAFASIVEGRIGELNHL